MQEERGIGKCAEDHVGSFGFPTRPAEPYRFCSQCGKPMIWRCAQCESPVPEDGDELVLARFCRDCGARYFDAEPEAARAD